MLKILKDWLFYPLRAWISSHHAQNGEDCVLARIIEEVQPGFYVDVGSHHPMRFSNTYFLYRSGWKGLTIDANPRTKVLFDFFRPRDKNVQAFIGLDGESYVYNEFDESALNGINASVEGVKLKSSRTYRAVGLSTVIKNNLGEGVIKIDLMSIDIEGQDFEAIKTLDFSKHQPSIIVVESEKVSVEEAIKSEMCKFLKCKGYVLQSVCFNSLIFTLDV